MQHRALASSFSLSNGGRFEYLLICGGLRLGRAAFFCSAHKP